MTLCRCFSTLGCPELSLDEALALAERHGVPFVEVRALGGTVDLPAYFSGTYGTPADLAGYWRTLSAGRAGAQRPQEVVALDASLHLVGATAVERAEILALAPWADALGVKWLRVFDGGRNADAAEVAAAGETIAWWNAQRRERGWQTRIMVETHDSLVNGERIARFVTAFPDTAILWDAHHTWRKGGEDPVATWKTIRRSVVHVHVKDSISVASARHPFTYVLPGDGGFPIAPLLDALRADGFAGALSLEWEKLWHPYLPSLDVALRTAAERKWW